MAHEVKVLDAKSDDPSSRLGTLMVEGEGNPASHPLISTWVPCMHMSTCTQKNKNRGVERETWFLALGQ